MIWILLWLCSYLSFPSSFFVLTFLFKLLLFLSKFDDAELDGWENSGNLLLISCPVGDVIRCPLFALNNALDLDVFGSSIFSKRFRLVSDLRMMLDSLAIVRSFNFRSQSGTC